MDITENTNVYTLTCQKCFPTSDINGHFTLKDISGTVFNKKCYHPKEHVENCLEYYEAGLVNEIGLDNHKCKKCTD